MDGYDLLAPISVGGTCRIWAARVRGSLGSDNLVALRMPAQSSNDAPGHEQSLLLETQLASRVKHPNVARYFGVVKHEGASCLVTEWIEGRSLRELLREASARGSLPTGAAVQIVVQACMGLQALHEVAGPEGRPLGWAHGELSLDDLMVDTQGTVKLVDLGFTRAHSHRPRDDAPAIPGSSFVAPEVARGEPIDVRADVFSAGALLYLLTTGRHPFEPSLEVRSAVPEGDVGIVFPTALIPSYPKALEGIAMRALSRQRRYRYQTMGEMLDALAAALPDSASTEELGEVVCRLCGDSLTRERARLDEALAGGAAPSPKGRVSLGGPERDRRERERAKQTIRRDRDAAPPSDTLLPSSQLRLNTFSPSYVSARHHDSAGVSPRVRGRTGLVIAGTAFVGAFAVTLVVSSPRTMGRPPPAAGTAASATTVTASRPVEPRSISSSTCGLPECSAPSTNSTAIGSVVPPNTSGTSQVAARPSASGAGKVLPNPSAAAPRPQRAKKPDAVLQRYGI